MKKIISAVAVAGLLITTSCHNAANDQREAELQAKQHTIDSMQNVMAQARIVDSMNEVSAMQVNLAPAPVQTIVVHTPARRSASHSSRSNYAGYNQSSNTASQPVYTAPAPVATTQKKGWSAKAKGAVIGAGAGAIGGAIIDKKNRGAGAIIGGLLGAGAGTGVGAIIDKKHGR